MCNVYILILFVFQWKQLPINALNKCYKNKTRLRNNGIVYIYKKEKKLLLDVTKIKINCEQEGSLM